MIKSAAKAVVVRCSWVLVHRYIRRFKPLIIGVTGSVGKTGTKRAIASILASQKRVAWQDGNYNDIVTVPLVFFGLNEPSLFNPVAWLVAFIKMFRATVANSGAEIVVLELGTDAPGQIAAFGKYVQLDIAVVTAVSPEHMENFGSLEAVAKEELSVASFARQVYVADDIDHVKDSLGNTQVLTYGTSQSSDVYFSARPDGELYVKTDKQYVVKPQLVGNHQYWALAVAVAIASKQGLSEPAIQDAVSKLRAMPGRMQVLAGKDGAMLIDDTYNSSPPAVEAALEYLYSLPTAHKIAVLGNMNEMGELSADLHKGLAQFCDPAKLELVITIGEDANKYLAPALNAKGVNVKTYTSPYDIGNALAGLQLANSALLFKGSQNGVFLEEAIKPLLANPDDANRLVRQSKSWMSIKHKQFGKVS